MKVGLTKSRNKTTRDQTVTQAEKDGFDSFVDMRIAGFGVGDNNKQDTIADQLDNSQQFSL